MDWAKFEINTIHIIFFKNKKKYMLSKWLLITKN